MTPIDIVHQRRLAAVTHAIRIGNVSQAARDVGISRRKVSEWKQTYEAYGPEALRPKPRRVVRPANTTPDHVVEQILQLAVTDPSGDARSYAGEVTASGYSISKSTVQNHLNRHGLGQKAQRFAAAGRLALFTQGLLTETTMAELRDDGPSGFCHWSPAPAWWIQMDCFYIGNLKGVGKVWQLTATDVRTRITDISIIRGHPNSRATARFLRLVTQRWKKRGFTLHGVITDNGSEFRGDFPSMVDTLGVDHQRIPPRSPNHNAVVERFHQTMLENCWRPAFHRRFYTSILQLQLQANSWLPTYHDTPNHGDWMKGTTPDQQLDQDQPQ